MSLGPNKFDMQGAAEDMSDFPGIGPEQGALIALVGIDGSGKSTNSVMLARSIAGHRPVETCYLGLGSSGMREKISSLGWPGRWFARFMDRRAEQSKHKEKKIPGAATAIVMYVLSRRRMSRFKKAHRMRRQGHIVIADRYPQNEVMGLYDGPLLSAARAESFIVKQLANAERRLYERMAETRPDLVVKLVISVDAALRRSPRHMRHDIERKALVGEKLSYNHAPIVEVDASRPLDEVFDEIQQRVLPALGIQNWS